MKELYYKQEKDVKINGVIKNAWSADVIFFFNENESLAYNLSESASGEFSVPIDFSQYITSGSTYNITFYSRSISNGLSSNNLTFTFKYIDLIFYDYGLLLYNSSFIVYKYGISNDDETLQFDLFYQYFPDPDNENNFDAETFIRKIPNPKTYGLKEFNEYFPIDGYAYGHHKINLIIKYGDNTKILSSTSYFGRPPHLKINKLDGNYIKGKNHTMNIIGSVTDVGSAEFVYYFNDDRNLLTTLSNSISESINTQIDLSQNVQYNSNQKITFYIIDNDHHDRQSSEISFDFNYLLEDPIYDIRFFDKLNKSHAFVEGKITYYEIRNPINLSYAIDNSFSEISQTFRTDGETNFSFYMPIAKKLSGQHNFIIMFKCQNTFQNFTKMIDFRKLSCAICQKWQFNLIIFSLSNFFI